MTSEQHTVDGRELGTRAKLTRRKLLDETARLLESRGVFELKVVDVCRTVGTSPATFYQYFADVDAAVLALADEAGERERALIPLISSAWVEPNGYAAVEEFVAGYWRFWEAHRGVLRVRNLKSEEDDRRFIRVRSRSSVPMAQALGTLVADGIESGRLSSALDPFATGGAMLGMIERLFVYQEVFGRRGSSVADLTSTLSTILYQTLVGEHPPDDR